MKLKEYMETKNTTKGLPVGDTYIEIEKMEIQDYEFKDEHGKTLVKSKIKIDDKEYYCPINVLTEMQVLETKGAKKVRVTRTGLTKNDTRYTVVAVQ